MDAMLHTSSALSPMLVRYVTCGVHMHVPGVVRGASAGPAFNGAEAAMHKIRRGRPSLSHTLPSSPRPAW